MFFHHPPIPDDLPVTPQRCSRKQDNFFRNRKGIDWLPEGPREAPHPSLPASAHTTLWGKVPAANSAVTEASIRNGAVPARGSRSAFLTQEKCVSPWLALETWTSTTRTSSWTNTFESTSFFLAVYSMYVYEFSSFPGLAKSSAGAKRTRKKENDCCTLSQ